MIEKARLRGALMIVRAVLPNHLANEKAELEKQLLAVLALIANPIWYGRSYDIAPDGQRFLMIKEETGGDQSATPASIVVVQHWLEELKARVPTK